MSSSITIEFTPVHDRTALAGDWRDLEDRACGGFFVSWTWVGAWLETLPENVEVHALRAQKGQKLVGLALLASGWLRPIPFLAGRGLWLHSTGRPELDAITIENNGLLVDSGEADVAGAMVDFLLSQKERWRRISLPLLRQPLRSSSAQSSRHFHWRTQEKTSWIVDLDKVRHSPSGYAGLLSAKTRYAIRRTRQACEARGKIEVSIAEGEDEIRSAMTRLLGLHRRRWEARPGGSSFDMPFVQRFHDRLLAMGADRGEIQLLTVTVGSHALGHLCCYVHRGRVSFYQSGVDYAFLGPKMSPGLLVIALAIEHNASIGHAVFDLLAGARHYKKDLSTHQETLVTEIVDRAGWQFALESQMRRRLRPKLERPASRPAGEQRWSARWLKKFLLGVSLVAIPLAFDACSEGSTPNESRERGWQLRTAPIA